MQYFIDAADTIIREQGVGAVTIRNVSELAGYTSATLYNYFDNLNHLVFLAIMSHLEDYSQAVNRCTKKCKNPVEICLAIFRCFCEYSFAEPEVYKLLFFTTADQKLEDYTQQYYDLFPEKADSEFTLMSKLSRVNNIYSRNSIMMQQCVEDGFLTQSNADALSEVSIMVYKSCLQDVLAGFTDQKTACDKFMRYYRQLFGFYLKPKYLSLAGESDC